MCASTIYIYVRTCTIFMLNITQTSLACGIANWLHFTVTLYRDMHKTVPPVALGIQYNTVTSVSKQLYSVNIKMVNSFPVWFQTQV